MRQTKYAVYLTEAERAQLRTLDRGGDAPARMLTHARILLKADQGEGGPAWTDAAIAGALEVHPATVARVRRAYVGAGLEAALARKRPDRVYARTLDGAARGPPGGPGLQRRRRPDASAGRCGCWRTNWSAWRWWRPSRTRRCGGP